jgi:hypothetical protein
VKKRTLFLLFTIVACLMCVTLTVITASSPSFKATATARAAARATAAAPTTTSTPTVTPTSTSTPAPTPTPVRVELREAEAKALLRVDVSGQGLESIRLVLESMSTGALEVTILPGTVFEAQTAGTQNMVVRKKEQTFLKAGDSKRRPFETAGPF